MTATLQGYTPLIMWVDEELVPFDLHGDDDSSDDDSLNHYYCCDKTRALCGSDLTRAVDRLFEVNQDACLVCAGLTRCPSCGDEFDELLP